MKYKTTKLLKLIQDKQDEMAKLDQEIQTLTVMKNESYGKGQKMANIFVANAKETELKVYLDKSCFNCQKSQCNECNK
jgi:hypothetical protein